MQEQLIKLWANWAIFIQKTHCAKSYKKSCNFCCNSDMYCKCTAVSKLYQLMLPLKFDILRDTLEASLQRIARALATPHSSRPLAASDWSSISLRSFLQKPRTIVRLKNILFRTKLCTPVYFTLTFNSEIIISYINSTVLLKLFIEENK